MSDKPNNPPAFPVTPQVVRNPLNPDERVFHHGHYGMTLRDYFAIRAPITLADAERTMADEDGGFQNWGTLMKRLAQMQLSYADIMLAEREKPHD